MPLKKEVGALSRSKYYDKASDGTVIDVTYQSKHEVLCDCAGLSLVYGNFYNDERTSGLAPYTVNVSAIIGGVNYPLYWDNGEISKTVQLGAIAKTDVLGVAMKKGEFIHIRTHVVQTEGQKHPIGLALFSSPNGEGMLPGDVTTGTFTPTSGTWYGLTPLALLATPLAIVENFRTIGICGDSISQGAGYSNTVVEGHPQGDIGFMQLGAMRAGWGYIAIGMNGQKASEFAAANKRKNRMRLIKDCDLVIVEYGTNDMTTESNTFQIVKNHILAIHQAFWEIGIPTAQTTLPPRTTSTDSWTTVGNQTPLALTGGAHDSIRTQINNWIRNNSDGIRCIETADLWESGRNSGAWRVAPVSTADGIHPNTAAHNVAADKLKEFLSFQ